MKDQLIQLIRSCDQLIQLMQDPDLDVQQQAIDTARGLLWRWVDEGNPNELINLLAAIRLLSEKVLTENFPDTG